MRPAGPPSGTGRYPRGSRLPRRSRPGPSCPWPVRRAKPGLLTADVGLVHLHRPGQPLPARADQHRPQPVQHRPRRLVRADLQRPLQAQRRDPVLLGGEQPAAVNHTVNGVRVRSKIVPAVTAVRDPQRPALEPAVAEPPTRRTAHTRARTRPATATTPGSPGSPRPCRTRPGTRPSSVGSAHPPSAATPPQRLSIVRSDGYPQSPNIPAVTPCGRENWVRVARRRRRSLGRGGRGLVWRRGLDLDGSCIAASSTPVRFSVPDRGPRASRIKVGMG